MLPKASLPAASRVLVAAFVSAALLSACGGGGEDHTPAPSPTPRPTPMATASPAPPPPETPYRLVYREYGEAEDVIWRAVPGDPAQRERLATIPHRAGHGVVASLSPDGRMLAYLTLPESALSETSSQAEAHVLDLKTGSTRLITEGVDYTFRPLWSPDGVLLFMRRLAGAEILLADVSIIYTKIDREPLEGEPTPTPTPSPTPLPPDQTPGPSPVPEDPVKTVLKARYSQVQSFIPIGWADDNRSLYFVQVNGGLEGTTLVGAYAPATAESIAKEATPTPDPNATPTLEPDPNAPPTPTPTPNSKLVVELTGQTASDFSLSPDRRKVAFAAGGIVDGQIVNQAFIADLIAGTVTPVTAQRLAAGDQLAPAWFAHSNGITVGQLPASGQLGAAALIDLVTGVALYLPAPPAGFDIPLSWSPDGTYLAVTNWSGDSLANRGSPSLDLVTPAGHRIRVAEGVGYGTRDAFVGWMG